VDLQMETFGIALAREWGTFSAGVAVRYQRFSEVADTFRRDLDAPGQPTFVVAQTNAGRVIGGGNDRDATFVAGVKWQPLEGLSVGAVFKKGPTFPVAVSAAHSLDAPLQLVASTEFHVPSTTGVGVSWRPAPQLTLNADVVRIGYGKLTDQFVSVIEYGAEDGGTIEAISGYQTEDGTELHAGVEYLVLSPVAVGIRAGWWRDPAHAIAYDGLLTTSHGVAAKILFPGARAENHYSVGVGMAFQRFAVDVAYDTSHSLQTASVSVIARR
jgi:long-subunit fatty acid transport protein